MMATICSGRSGGGSAGTTAGRAFHKTEMRTSASGCVATTVVPSRIVQVPSSSWSIGPPSPSGQ